MKNKIPKLDNGDKRIIFYLTVMCEALIWIVSFASADTKPLAVVAYTHVIVISMVAVVVLAVTLAHVFWPNKEK